MPLSCWNDVFKGSISSIEGVLLQAKGTHNTPLETIEKDLRIFSQAIHLVSEILPERQ